MAFGITPQGFVPKRLADIKSEIEATLRATFGSTINLDARGPWGQFVGIQAEREAAIWELAEIVYQSQFPAGATGTGVDNVLEFVGLKRKSATQSTAFVKFFGAVGTVIPLGNRVSKVDDAAVIFETTQIATILAGSGVDEVQKINFSDVPDAGSWQIDFDGQQTGVLAFNISAGLLQTELNNLSNLSAVTVTGNFTIGFTINFLGADGQKPQPQITIINNTLTKTSNPITATPTTLTEGVLPSVNVPMICQTFGSIVSPANTLTVLTDAIVGIVSVNNPLDAEVGDDVETDADALIRRGQSLAFPGHSTVNAILAELLQIDGVVAARVFENTALVVDINGRPAKSYEAIVQGGDDTDIARVMLDTKPAGIQQIGSTLVVLNDSQGFAKDVRFSRPTAIPIHVIADLVVSAEYPANGDDLVRDAILAYGDALNIGQDVIVIPKLVCAFDEIPGILDANIRIGVTTIPVTGSSVVTFTNVATKLTANLVAHGLTNGDRVRFTNSGGALPTGLAINTTYWVRNVTANTFELSTQRTSTVLPFADAGTGTHTVLFGGLEENIEISESERADFDTSRITVNS